MITNAVEIVRQNMVQQSDLNQQGSINFDSILNIK